MTIPVQPVQIHPQFVAPQHPGLELLLTALQHRQELQLAQKKFAQDQQQFELSKKLGTASIAHSEAETARIKSELKAREDDLDAHSEALGIVNGHLDVLRDPQAWGSVWARIKNPRVAGWVQTLRDEQLDSQQKIATLNNTGRDSFSAAGQTPEGLPVSLNTHTGKFQAGGPQLRQPGQNAALNLKMRTGAGLAADAIRRALTLVTGDQAKGVPGDPRANELPVWSDIAGSAAESKLAGYVPGMKGAAGYLRRRAMSANQNKFQNLLNIVAHNAVGLLPGSRQSVVLFQNLRDSYAVTSGDPPELRAQKLDMLRELGTRLDALRRGETVSLADLPGFEEHEPVEGSAQPTQQSADTTVTPMRGRYHPKFNRP